MVLAGWGKEPPVHILLCSWGSRKGPPCWMPVEVGTDGEGPSWVTLDCLGPDYQDRA